MKEFKSVLIGICAIGMLLIVMGCATTHNIYASFKARNIYHFETYVSTHCFLPDFDSTLVSYENPDGTVIVRTIKQVGGLRNFCKIKNLQKREINLNRRLAGYRYDLQTIVSNGHSAYSYSIYIHINMTKDVINMLKRKIVENRKKQRILMLSK